MKSLREIPAPFTLHIPAVFAVPAGMGRFKAEFSAQDVADDPPGGPPDGAPALPVGKLGPEVLRDGKDDVADSLPRPVELFPDPLPVASTDPAIAGQTVPLVTPHLLFFHALPSVALAAGNGVLDVAVLRDLPLVWEAQGGCMHGGIEGGSLPPCYSVTPCRP